MWRIDAAIKAPVDKGWFDKGRWALGALTTCQCPSFHRLIGLAERAVVLVHQPALDGDRPLVGRLAMGHDGVVCRPRRGREAVVPDLAEAGVRIADHMEGGGGCRARGGEGGDGDNGGSSKGADVMHGLSPDGVIVFLRRSL